jgi:hypothetical protein
MPDVRAFTGSYRPDTPVAIERVNTAGGLAARPITPFLVDELAGARNIKATGEEHQIISRLYEPLGLLDRAPCEAEQTPASERERIGFVGYYHSDAEFRIYVAKWNHR